MSTIDDVIHTVWLAEDREQRICKVLNRPIHCLGKTKAGRPKHPLYLRADLKPELFWEP